MSYRRSGSREARMRKARTAPWSAVLAVAGDDDDRLDDRAAANRQPAPDDVDIDAELRTQQRQQDEQADQDEQAIRLDPRDRDPATAAGRGRSPTNMRPPSNGGSGNRLNPASITFSSKALRKFSASHCAAVSGRKGTMWNARPAAMARTTLMAGPAAATRIMSRRGCCSAENFTGTGLA